MTTTANRTTAQRLADLRAEHEQLTARVAELAQKAVDTAFLSEAGDPDARQRHAELSAARSAAENRLRELSTAITSGEKHAEREAAEAAEAGRLNWSRRADDLRTAQLDAAQRLDAALAAADAAWNQYVSASDARGAAMRQAGRGWSGAAWVSTFLARVLWRHTPTLARLVRQDPELRKHAATAAEMVQ